MSDLREDLKAYLDGELGPEQAERVRLALAQDDDLRQEYEFMKLLTNEIKTGAKEVETKGETETLKRVAGPPARSPWRMFATLSLTLVGVAILAAVLFPVFAQSKDEAKSTMRFTEAKASSVADSPGAEAAKPAAPLFKKADGSAIPQAEAAKRPYSPPAANDSAKAADDAPVADAKASESSAYRTGGESAKAVAPPVVSQPNTVDVPQMSRQVVKDGAVEVKVRKVSEAVDQVNGMLQKFQGFAESTNQSKTPEGEILAMMRVRVPVQNYEALLVSVRQMGDVVTESSNGNDVTGQVMDYDARLKVLRSQMADYEALLKKARRTSDVIELKDRISEVQTQIEQLTAQRKNLDGLARFSSLSITFHQGQPDKFAGTAWFDESSEAGRTALTGVGSVIGRVVVFLAWLLPILVPAGLVAWWWSKKLNKA